MKPSTFRMPFPRFVPSVRMRRRSSSMGPPERRRWMDFTLPRAEGQLLMTGPFKSSRFKDSWPCRGLLSRPGSPGVVGRRAIWRVSLRGPEPYTLELKVLIGARGRGNLPEEAIATLTLRSGQASPFALLRAPRKDSSRMCPSPEGNLSGRAWLRPFALYRAPRAGAPRAQVPQGDPEGHR